MSPESTVAYYEHITRACTQRFGDYGYPEILIYSVNFQKFVDWQRSRQWSLAAAEMASALEALRRAGADFGLIATNMMHIVFDEVQQAVGGPLLNIIDATAEAILAVNLHRVGLLGTVFTMREPFFRERLQQAGIEVLTPAANDQDCMNEVIYQELCGGRILPASRTHFLEIIERLRARGAQGIVLGCTEIPLLVGPEDCVLPLFNTSLIHAEKALQWVIQAC